MKTKSNLPDIKTDTKTGYWLCNHIVKEYVKYIKKHRKFISGTAKEVKPDRLQLGKNQKEILELDPAAKKFIMHKGNTVVFTDKYSEVKFI